MISRTDNSIRLRWPADPDSNPQTFNVYRATLPGILGDRVATTTDTTYLDVGIVSQPTAAFFYAITVADSSASNFTTDVPVTVFADDAMRTIVPLKWISNVSPLDGEGLPARNE